MTISTNTAYRIYSLKAGKKAILFHTRKREYMFLDGLSAELLELLLSTNQTLLEDWMATNEISAADVSSFADIIQSFDSFNSSSEDSPSSIALKDESSEDKYILNLFQNQLVENGLYYTFHIDLTNRCNERCIHSYHPFQSYDYSSELSLEEIQHLIDILYDLGVFTITLSGGEALLRKDIFSILQYISDKGMYTTLFSNGLLLSEEVVSKLLNYRINMVSISLYGDNEEIHDNITTVPGSFCRTLSGINLLRKYGIPFELKCVVLAENIDRIDAMRNLSRNLNYGKDCRLDFSLCGKVDGDCSVYSHKASTDKIAEVFYSDPRRFIGERDHLPRSANEAPCAAGKYGLYCSADGNIYPCVSFRLFLCKYKDLPDIHSNKVLQKWLNTKISDFSECFKHDYCNYCTEQCAGNNLIENGDFLNSNISHCERAKIIANWYKNHSIKYKEVNV